ncbi:MAG: prepilin-type N-terminal cleavage/methylation domain-containing protein [Albidovulum sp.]|uniref:prepilin-type N-terminal cleavage/methylation domain-containing protein n=1 Tax=Albidovulum sp. TaxID=1872424 RepID=UPI003C84913C
MKGRSGLSLFEMLIALALLAFIAAGLSGSLGLSIRLLDRSRADPAVVESAALRARLRHWIANMAPQSLLTPFPNQFVGAGDHLTFTTMSDTPFAPDAAALVVTIAETEGTVTLSAASIDDGGTEIQVYQGVLARDVGKVSISYFAPDDDPPAWLSEWPDSGQLPALVRIEIGEGSVPDWPEFTAHPLLGP